MNRNLEVKFKKIHEDAILPARKHDNRVTSPYEEKKVADENAKLQVANPQAFVAGYRVEFPKEIGEDGELTDWVLGTGDTGYDIFSVEDKTVPAGGSAVIDTGIEVAYISPGYWFKIEARSGMGFNHSVQPHAGIIDNPYRGNLGVKLYSFDSDYQVGKGQRIAQLVFYPVLEPCISWSDEKLETERSDKGFGSSGK